MSSHTVANLPRLSPTDLSKILLTQTSSNLDAPAAPPSHLAIVDVRDDDHIGGHIKHSIHAPSRTLEHKIPELVRKLKDKEIVVFHCALSQQRGPAAALKYMRERERLLGRGSKLETAGTGVGEAMKKNRSGKGDKGAASEEADSADWEDVEEPAPAVDGGESKEQKVYVLDRGFVGWQERFGEDTRLTEGYRKEIWKHGYWM